MKTGLGGLGDWGDKNQNNLRKPVQLLLLDDETLDQVDGGEPGIGVALLLHLHGKDNQILFRRQYFDAFVRFFCVSICPQKAVGPLCNSPAATGLPGTSILCSNIASSFTI